MNCLLALCFVALSFSAYSISFPEEGEVWWKELYFEVDWECDVNETRLLVVSLVGPSPMVIAPAVYSLAYSSVRPGAPGYMFWWVPPSLLDGQYTVTLSDYYSHAVVATSPVFNISVRPETRDPFPPPTQLSQSGSKDISLPAVPPHQGLNPSDFPSIFFVDLLPQPNGQPYGAQIWFDSLTPGANQTAFFDYAELPDFKSTGNGDYYKSIHSGQVSAMSTYGRYYFVLLPDGPPSQVSIASSARVTLKIALPCPDCDMTHGICQAGVCQCFPGYSGSDCGTKIPTWSGNIEKIPVIIIPGTGGTRLEVPHYFGKKRDYSCQPGNVVWAGSIGDAPGYFGLGAGFAAEYLPACLFNLSTGRVDNMNPDNPVDVPFSDDVFGLQQIETLLSQSMCEAVAAIDWWCGTNTMSPYPYNALVNQFLNRNYTRGQDIRGLPYDWRQSNRDLSALTRLHNIVVYLASKSPCGQVDIVSHSMGGLLFRSYVATFPQDQRLLRRYVAVGAPWAGATGLPFLAFTSGYNFGNVVVSNYTARNALVQMPSAYELLPNVSAFESDPFKCVDESGNTFSGSQIFSFLASHQRMRLDPNRASDFATLLSFAQDTWTLWKKAVLAPHVKYYNIAGAGVPTLHSIAIGPYSSTSGIQDTDGDGTVPLTSAINYPFKPFRSLIMAGVSHGDLVINSPSVESILSFLGSGQFWEGNYTGLRISQNHSQGLFYLGGEAPVPVYFVAVFAFSTASHEGLAELSPDGSFVGVFNNGQWMSYGRITNSQCTDGQYQVCSNSPNGRFYRPCVFGSYVSQCSLVSCFPGFCELEVDGITTCGACE